MFPGNDSVPPNSEPADANGPGDEADSAGGDAAGAESGSGPGGGDRPRWGCRTGRWGRGGWSWPGCRGGWAWG